MSTKKVVIALGGNALGNNAKEQANIVKDTAKAIIDLYVQKKQIVVVHGNGPQVGMINNSFTSSKEDMPFPECGAMSQGYIGYHIQNAIQNEAADRSIDVSVVTLITQTLVDADDQAFKNPSKPIGSFYSEVEAKDLAKKNGWVVKEDAGRGWRRVVPSPAPVSIVEQDALETIMKDPKVIVITGGGGGIPVVKKGNNLIGVDAVIDKDSTSAVIANSIKADSFMILTAVDKIFLNYNTPQEEAIDEINLKDLSEHYNNNVFAEGSMKPKVKAIMNFVQKSGNDGYIANLKLVGDVLSGKSGTRVFKK